MPEFDVFLSHSNLDDDLASAVKRLLEENDISVFATPSSIPTGAWEPQIEEALQHSEHLWVLLTPNALEASTWVHHEFGYYYGLHHGQELDQQGHRCHYVYEEDTYRPGLYSWIQGVGVETLERPETIAETIAISLGREFNLPPGWERRIYPTASRGVIRHPNIGMIQVNGDGHEPSTNEGYWRVTIRELDQPIYHVSALTAHSEADIKAIRNADAMTPTQPGVIRLTSKYRDQPLQELPTEGTDYRNRRFELGPEFMAPEDTTPLLITFETADRRALAAIVYYTVQPQQHGFPEIVLRSATLIDWRMGQFLN